MMGNKKYVSVYPWIDDRKLEDSLICSIEDTPENISAFIVNSDYDTCYAFVEENGNVKVYSNGQFLDYVPDTNYLENELKPVLLKMQFGDMDIPDIIYENDNSETVKAICLKGTSKMNYLSELSIEEANVLDKIASK